MCKGRELSVAERCERSVVPDQYDRLGLPRLFVATHARRIRRHSRHGDSDGVRSTFQQGDDCSDWDVTLYDVAIDQSRVTRDCIEWNTHFCLERGKGPIFLHLDVRSVVL